jgi:hypothetical protein
LIDGHADADMIAEANRRLAELRDHLELNHSDQQARRASAEIRIRAERKAGHLLRGVEKSEGGGDNRKHSTHAALSDQKETPFQKAKREAHTRASARS